MSKDPAFLFYYQDFLVGSDHMTNEEVGAYIRCLCHQANRGSIREQHMKNICIRQDVHLVVQEKFVQNEAGDWFNEKLALLIEKRAKYAESRRNNRLPKHMKNISEDICSDYVPHMENENENINEIIKAFNNICGTNYKLKTKATRSMINARLEEGHSVQDCVSVISKKYEQWKRDPEMAKYIRIETLFRPSKFEGYLNEKLPIKESDVAQKRTDDYLASIGFEQ